MIHINNNLRYNHCQLCGAASLHKVGDINYFSPVSYSTEQVLLLSTPELWKCSTCHSAFVQNAVPEKESISLYSRGEAAKRWSNNLTFEQSKTNVVVETLKKLLKKEARILDVGCNTGELLDFAKDRGSQTFGVEYSLCSLNLLKEKNHIGYSSIVKVDRSFDIITAFDLVEHLYNLPEFLEFCFDRLSPDGYLVFLTGDICCFSARLMGSNWWYVRYPEHITFPSRKYFELHPKFQVIEWIPTYAAPFYEVPIIRAVKNTVKALQAGDYSGLPSFGSDHALIILKCKKSR